MPALKKSSVVSRKATVKPATPVSAKRVTTKALLTKPTTTPAKPVQTTVKPVTKKVTKPLIKVMATQEVKVEKIKKPKLIRDSFTIPKAEYLVIETLKERAGKLARAAKKSELLRAGIKALAAMSDANFLNALNAVPTIKTGRPSTVN
jgi:hypothetical protein